MLSVFITSNQIPLHVHAVFCQLHVHCIHLARGMMRMRIPSNNCKSNFFYIASMAEITISYTQMISSPRGQRILTSSLWEHDLRLLEPRYMLSPSVVSVPLHVTASITMGSEKIRAESLPLMTSTPASSKDSQNG